MLNLILEETKEKMDKSIDAFKNELSTVRTGRANPTMLDRVMVNYYGEKTPLNQMASISVVEGRQLMIKPYDKSTLKDIEHGVYEADLGLAPQNDGEVIRINVPALTEETRRGYVKQAKKFAEDAKVALRNIRRSANDDVDKAGLTEDEVNAIRTFIKEMNVEGDLRREVALNIKRLVEIGSYRGIRHRRGLPVRGQKTKTNARTRKGPKKTIANKKK